MRTLSAVLMVIIGASLLIVSLLGVFTTLSNYGPVEPRSWERYKNSSYETVESIRDLNQLALQTANDRYDTAWKKLNTRHKMDHLYQVASNYFAHSDKARYNLFSNWILWGASAVHPDFAHIRNSNTLVARGRGALCGQASYTLMKLAQLNDIRVRHVGLLGHVVMEAWYNEQWHMYDPDNEGPSMGMINTNKPIPSVNKIANNKNLYQKIYSNNPKSNKFWNVFQTQYNNTYMTYPPGTWFHWKVEVLSYFEAIMQVIKWVVPVVFIVLGGLLLFGPAPEKFIRY